MNPYAYAQQQAAYAAHMQAQAAAAAPTNGYYAAAPAAYGAYPPAPAYHQQQQHAAYAPQYAVPAPVAPVEVAPVAPLSPISAMRAREAEMAALALAQAAAVTLPAAAAAQPANSSSTAQQAEEEEAVDPNVIEMKLENAHYNLNEVLGANLVAHAYWKDLSRMSTLDEVVDEVYATVKHVEPMVANRDRLPSTACFLLYKMFTLEGGITKRQMHDLLRHKDSPYIRALGFLYLRCVSDPKGLWGWFEPYLDDPAVFVPGQQDATPQTIGQYVRNLLQTNEYYNMKLRRIPIPVQREYQLKLLARDARLKRAERNEPFRARVTKGLKLQAEYHADCKFYDAVIDRVEEGPQGKFLVTFLEYGNVEEVDIGALKLPSSITDEHIASSSTNSSSISAREKVPERDAPRERDADRRSRDRSSRSRERERDRTRSRDKDRERDRERDRDRRSRRSSRSRSRTRSRERYRSSRSSRDSRERDRSRGRDRRGRLSSRSRSRSPSSSSRPRGDVFSDLPDTARGVYRGSSSSASASSSYARPRSPSPEVSLEALIRKERETAVASGKDYARRPSSYKNSLSMSLISGTVRRRSRTPPPQARREQQTTLPPIEEVRKPQMTEEQKAARAALMAKYGDAASQKDIAAKRANRRDDDDNDIIRLGM